MAKKSFVLIFTLIAIIILPLILAQSKISIEPIKESFKAGENITLKVSLLDEKNAPINQEISLTLEDVEKKGKIEKNILTNKFIDVDIGNVSSGYWKITAFYKDEEQGVQDTTLVFIHAN